MANILPIYYQIKEKIKKMIFIGEYKLGDKIPSEYQLASHFETTRRTVRQAIAYLIDEGFLFSRQGQGSFVTMDRDVTEVFSMDFTGTMDELNHQLSISCSKTVEKELIKCSNYVREKLELDKAVEEVVQIKQVRVRNNKLMAYSISYFPVKIGNQLSEEEMLRKSWHSILQDDLNIKMKEAVMVTEASFADREVAEKLNLNQGSPILFAEWVMYTNKRKPIEFIQSSYPAETSIYTVKFKTRRGRKNNRNA